MAVVPSINKENQGGQGAITLYALDRYIEQQRKQAQVAMAIVTAPIVPTIVNAPAEPLPSSIIKTLPTITSKATTAAGAVIQSAGRCAEQQAREMEQAAGNWMCRLGYWVQQHPLLALGVIAGTYVVTRGK